MKKLLLLLVSALFVSSSFASHLMGGQITAKPISGANYLITMTLYRDTYGIPMNTAEIMNIVETSGAYPDFNLSIPSVAVPYINNTEEYVYSDSVIFPGPGIYNISYSNCCRNAAIVNGPANHSFYLNTIVEVDPVNPNSTPEFLNRPITIAPLNNLWVYNPLPFDADGDSLAWHLTIPMEFENDPCSPYILPYGDSTQPFTLDTITGEITWIPDSIGYFVASFLVDEFRAGVKIGEIRRDMQIIVTPISGARAAFSASTWPINADGNYQFELNTNTPFSLSVLASDFDLSFISLHPVGEPLCLGYNPATFTSSVNSNGIAMVNINWTPSPSQARSTPYRFAVRCNENDGAYVLGKDITLLFHVNTVTGIQEHNDGSIGAMYPNLVSNEINLPLTLAKPAKFELSIFNSLGQKAGADYIYELNSGSQLVTLNDLNLQGGLYFLRIYDGERVTVQKFICTNGE